MPYNDYFIFNGQKSSDFGLRIAKDPNAVHPARRGDALAVPGRNGVIVREDGSYETYTQVYDVLIDSNSDGIYERAHAIADWLLGSRGFCRLEDSFEPLYFRSARCSAQLDIENRLTRFGRAQIAFECQPQRFLKSGESTITFRRTKLAGEAELYNRKIIVNPLPHGTRTIKLDVLQSDQWSGGSIGKLELISVDSPDSGIETPMNEVPGEGDFHYTNVMDSSSARYIAGSRYSLGSHAFVDSENPECDCVVVPVPQNNETVRIRVKNATFSTWNTTYGGSSNSSFSTDYGRHTVGSSTPTDEYGDIYFDFQNNGSRFITFNIEPMSDPSSLIVTVNEPIIVINPDGLNEYVGTHHVSESYVAQESHAVRVSYFDSSDGSWFLLANMIIQDAEGNTLLQASLSSTNMALFNNTDNTSQPIIMLADKSGGERSPVRQNLNMNVGRCLDNAGYVAIPPDRELVPRSRTSNPVSVDGYKYAIISGSGYAFYNSSGKRVGDYVRSIKNFSPTNPFNTVTNKKVIIPSGAKTVIVSEGDNPQASLLLQVENPSPGDNAITVNGTSVSVDFSNSDTIVLDSDLHDASYLDGSNANSAVSFSNPDELYPTFPGLNAGVNSINVRDSKYLEVSITPRWWVL